MNILEKIVRSKTEYIAGCRKLIPEKEMIRMGREAADAPSFSKAMSKDGLSIIGEIKKASPSRGVIDPVFDYMAIAAEYEKCVDAVSVLTETDFFLGSPDYLKEISENIVIPVLRKDFVIDSYQIFEAKSLGASCILLIAAILDSVKLRSFIQLAAALGLDSLVEVHDECEFYRALRAGAGIIGVNNRNLRDFTVDIRKTAVIGALVPEDVLLISESGISTGEDAAFVKKAGADGILVGESFMRSDDRKKLAEILKNA